MKLALISGAVLATALLSIGANAAQKSGTTFQAPKGSGQKAGLVWKCGKNNPAWWGTFGNGCLKQKRAWKRKHRKK